MTGSGFEHVSIPAGTDSWGASPACACAAPAGDRFRLQTDTSGVVHLQLAVLMKDFEVHHVHC